MVFNFKRFFRLIFINFHRIPLSRFPLFVCFAQLCFYGFVQDIASAAAVFLSFSPGFSI